MLSDIHITAAAPRSGLRRKLRATAGLALVDMLVSVLILGIGGGTAISCLTATNRMAAINRSRNAAEALCQERVAQVVAASFSPPARIPSYFGATWPVSATETVTSTESVPLCTDAGGGGTINGTRTTRVSLADATLKLVRVTARVSYTYRGRDYVCETFTLRSPD